MATIEYVFEPVMAYTNWRKRIRITDRAGMTFVLVNGRWYHAAMTDYHHITRLLDAPPSTKVKYGGRTLVRCSDSIFESHVKLLGKQIEQTGTPTTLPNTFEPTFPAEIRE
jgi:hypothetical protein